MPNFCHRYPEYRFLSQFCIPFPNFGESRFPGRSQIPNAVNATRIPHVCFVCFFFWSYPRSREIPFQTQFSCLLFAVVSIAMHALADVFQVADFFIIWLHPRAGKMKGVLHPDWLPLGLSTSCSRFSKKFPVISQKVAQKTIKGCFL